MVNIIQLLCPARHCIMGVAYDPADATFEATVRPIRDMLNRGAINAWCGICGSHALHFEERATSFKTLPEALPHLAETEAKNISTRAALDQAGISYDKSRLN